VQKRFTVKKEHSSVLFGEFHLLPLNKNIEKLQYSGKKPSNNITAIICFCGRLVPGSNFQYAILVGSYWNMMKK
jgi:hypothetical protein